jgi:hypothetical protein
MLGPRKIWRPWFKPFDYLFTEVRLSQQALYH